MSELTGNALREYITRVRDLEHLCYKQHQYVMQLMNKLYSAEHPKLYAKHDYKKYNRDISDVFAYAWIACTVIGMIIAIILFLVGNATEIKEIKNEAHPILQIIPLIIMFIIISLFGGFLGNIGGIIIGGILDVTLGRFIAKRKLKAENKALEHENREIEHKNQNILANAKTQAGLLRAEMQRAASARKETVAVLEKYYSMNIVYEKYRGLVPITMFCEYLESGRCDSLSGHEGAYNIYENEIRLNLIITKLDDIVTRLDEITQNQYMLSHLLRENNREIQRLADISAQQASSLQRIETNSEISAYYDGITATNTSYLAYLAWLDR